MKSEFVIIKNVKDDRDMLTMVLSDATSTERSLVKSKLMNGYGTPDELEGLFDYQSNSYSLCFLEDLEEIVTFYKQPKTNNGEK